MRELPILFSAPMVRAILAGRKTQTRRVAKLPTKGEYVRPDMGGWEASTVGGDGCTLANGEHAPERACIWNRTTGTTVGSRYEPGARLWVRETWAEVVDEKLGGKALVYRADSCAEPERWRPAIHMPRSACRIRLDIVAVRAERLGDICEADCLAEGCAGGHGSIPGYAFSATPYEHFRSLWDSLNAARGFGFAANPWVWVVEFRRGA
jgi:hypothetical protein